MISWNHWVPQYVRDEIKRKTGKIVGVMEMKKSK